jgi:septum formation protein
MLQANDPPLVLASGSASRRTLLEAAGLRFTIMPAPVDEDEVRRSAQAEGAEPGEAAMLLADLKARAAERRMPGAIVVGADQILVCNETWFSKPADMDAAREHLRSLRGQTHRLETAVLCRRNGARIWQHLSRPALTMRPFSDAFLEEYLAAEGDAVLGSVGCYRLEGLGMHLFDRVEGEHAAILGLPMLPLLGFLRQHGVLTR